MSWESTAVYYRVLNLMARERFGGRHSAALLMLSVDFAPIADLQAAGAWDKAANIMIDAAQRLERAGATCMIVCANTMHRMADEIQAAISVPLLHVADAVAVEVRAAGVRRPLLLATRFTMEQPFYIDRLSAGGVTAVIPPLRARERLHAIIYDELVQGRVEAASRADFVAIVERAIADDQADGAILGCTEFGLLVGPEDISAPIFDTTLIHARAAMDFAQS